MGKHNVGGNVVTTQNEDFEPCLSLLEKYIGDTINEEEYETIDESITSTQEEIILSDDYDDDTVSQLTRLLRTVRRVVITVSKEDTVLNQSTVDALKDKHPDTVERLESHVSADAIDEFMAEWKEETDEEILDIFRESEERFFPN